MTVEARDLRLSGADENGDPQTEIVTLDGLTPVTTVGRWKGSPTVSDVTGTAADPMGDDDG